MSKFSLSKLTTAISNKMGRAGLKFQKATPDILVGLGIVGIIGATVLFGKEMREAEEILDEFKDELDAVHAEKEDAIEKKEEVDEKAYRAEVTRVYVHNGVALGRTFAPSIVLYGISFASILKGYGILKTRNFDLAAAYAGLDASFRRYRNNVADKYGEEEERAIRYGRNEVEYTDEDDAEQSGLYQFFNVPEDGSEYGRWFCKGTSTQFEGSPTYDLAYAKGRQAQFNQLLQSRGHVFLNEVYDAFGFDRTPAGAVVGWVLGNGDDYIDFGINGEIIYQGKVTYDPTDLSGMREGFWLDFNVDGPMFDKI